MNNQGGKALLCRIVQDPSAQVFKGSWQSRSEFELVVRSVHALEAEAIALTVVPRSQATWLPYIPTAGLRLGPCGGPEGGWVVRVSDASLPIVEDRLC